MIARDLAEQFPELPGDEAAVDPPVVVDPACDASVAPPVADPPALDAAAPPVDAPAEPPETVDELKAAYVRLTADNIAMRVRIALLEMPPEEHWVELKRVACDAYKPKTSKAVKSACERLRRLIEFKKVEAQKVDGRWFVDANGPKLKARLKLLPAK